MLRNRTFFVSLVGLLTLFIGFSVNFAGAESGIQPRKFVPSGEREHILKKTGSVAHS